MSMAVHIVFSVDRLFASKGPNDTQWTLCVIHGVPRMAINLTVKVRYGGM